MISSEIRLENRKIETLELPELDIKKYPYPKKIGKTNKHTPIKYGDELFPLPSIIMLETSSSCNNNCSFCPSGDLKRRHEEMNWKLYIKIIDELDIMEYKDDIQLFNSNEPLMDTQLVERIKYIRTKKNLQRNMISTLTNMNLLTRELLIELKNAGLNELVCDIYITDEEYEKKFEPMFKDLQGTDIHNYRFWNNKIKVNKEKLSIMLYSRNNIDPKKVFGKNFNSRLQLIDTGKDLKDYKTRMCVKPFRHATITYDGKFLVCCEEWLYDPRGIVGDLNKNTFVDIWNGKPMMNIRYRLLQRNRDFYPCNMCDNPGDPYWFAVRSVEDVDK